mgnify:CR=1 FL=1
MQQRGVDLAGGVETTGADEAPDDRGREGRPSQRTREAVRLVLIADVAHVAQHPHRDARLGQRPQDRGDSLREEQRPRRDLEVVAQLHVHGEVDALAHDVRGQDLEDHVRERFSLEHVSADELAQDVELVRVHVGDALDDPARNHIDGRDDERQEHAVHGQLGLVDLDHDDREGGDGDDDPRVPVPGRARVSTHEPGVDVHLVPALEGVPDILCVPAAGVRQDGCDGREGEAVDEGECRRKVWRGVVPVRLDVQRLGRFVHHFRDIVHLSHPVVDVGRHEREVGCVPSIRVEYSGDDDPEEYDEPDEDVDGGPGRGQERIRVVRNLAPVERDGTEPEARLHSEKVVHDQILGRDPADPSEVAQRREHQTRQEVPHERAGHHVEEEPLPGDPPPIRDRVRTAVQRLQQRAV